MERRKFAAMAAVGGAAVLLLGGGVAFALDSPGPGPDPAPVVELEVPETSPSTLPVTGGTAEVAVDPSTTVADDPGATEPAPAASEDEPTTPPGVGGEALVEEPTTTVEPAPTTVEPTTSTTVWVVDPACYTGPCTQATVASTLPPGNPITG
jgi:hypothetical protein